MFLFSRAKIDTDVDAGASVLRADHASAHGLDAALVASLHVLGLQPGASWEQVTQAHCRLVSDLTPGPGASHRNVALAEQFLAEVNKAYASLRVMSVA